VASWAAVSWSGGFDPLEECGVGFVGDRGAALVNPYPTRTDTQRLVAVGARGNVFGDLGFSPEEAAILRLIDQFCSARRLRRNSQIVPCDRLCQDI
jgi:hypothetical protein